MFVFENINDIISLKSNLIAIIQSNGDLSIFELTDRLILKFKTTKKQSFIINGLFGLVMGIYMFFKTKKMQKEDVRELTDEHRILLDENIPKNEKVSYFLKVRKGVEMSPERVTELLGSEEEK